MLRFVYDECEGEDDETYSVYILSKSQMNGRHVELFTFCLYQNLLSGGIESYFKVDYEETTSTEENPCLHITFAQDNVAEITFSIHFDSETDQFEIWFDRSDVEILPDVYPALVERGFEAQDGDDDGWSKRSVDRSDIIEEIASLEDLMCAEK